MTDMEPDDMEAIVILLLELNRNNFKGSITFVVGGACAVVSRVRLQVLLSVLKSDGIEIVNTILVGISDPLNIKNEYWTDLKSSTDISDDDKTSVVKHGELYDSLRTCESKIRTSCPGVTPDFFNAVSKLAFVDMQHEQLINAFRNGKLCVVCLKKADELIWLHENNHLRFEDCVLWLYAGQYNVKSAKHDDNAQFQQRMLTMLNALSVEGSVVIMSRAVVLSIDKVNIDDIRDILELPRYNKMCGEPVTKTLTHLRERTLSWNRAMYKKWVSEAGLAAYEDLDAVNANEPLKNRARSDIKQSIKGFQKEALLNILVDPNTQRVIADQLAVLLFFGRVYKHRRGTPAFNHKGHLAVHTGTDGNVFEVEDIAVPMGLQQHTTKEQMTTTVDSIMSSVMQRLTSRK